MPKSAGEDGRCNIGISLGVGGGVGIGEEGMNGWFTGKMKEAYY